MPDELERIRRAWARDLALVALKDTRLFAHTSWRLLRDFVDVVGTARFLERKERVRDIQLLAVASGRVRMELEGGLGVFEVEPGVHFADATGFHDTVRIESVGTEPAGVFWVEEEHWQRLEGTPTLVRSLSLQGLADPVLDHLQRIVSQTEVELIWVGCSEELRPIAAPLLQLVASGLSTLCRNERIVTVQLGPTGLAHVATWIDGAVLPGRDPSQIGQAQRLLILRSAAPLEPPSQGPFSDPSARVHRILLLHEGTPPDLPPALLGRLHSQLGAGPDPERLGLFSSILSVALRPPRPPRTWAPQPPPAGGTPGSELREMLGGLFASAVGLLERRSHFRTTPVLDGMQRRSSPPGRLGRDALRVELDAPALQQAWQMQRGDPADFVMALIANDDAYRNSAARVGRAGANKQVGIAVSGGGASAFRVAGLLEMLETGAEAVPIDYFAGVSGGALVGAYYCALGVPGVQHLIEQAGLLARVVPLLFVTSWPLEAWIDADLQGLRIEELDAPAFLPVATELAGQPPPEAVVIVAGTLGEAVRASGSLPLGFAPTEKNGRRYGDGAAATLIPVQALWQADVILGCNVIPGPASSNPWYDVKPVELAYRHTLVGRVIDSWTWTAFLLQNATALAGKGADVFLRFQPQMYPSRETVEWGQAGAIAAAGSSDPNLPKAAHELFQAWQNVGT